jgi:hypothetical protein
MEASPKETKPDQRATGWLVATPLLAAIAIALTVLLVKDEKEAVALPSLIAVGILAIVTSWVALSAVARSARPDKRGRLQDEEAPTGLTLSQGIVLLLTLVVLTALPAGVVVGTVALLQEVDTFRPEIILPIIVVIGVIGLVAVLGSLVAVFVRLGLGDPRQALGLPEGSIQAVIALGLILIFAIVGIYLHALAGDTETRLLAGLTQEKVDALPANTIVEINTREDGRFDVRVALPPSEQQDDISKQLLTTISTLVVAVAGFYFGSKTVKEAQRGLRDGLPDSERQTNEKEQSAPSTPD